MGDSTPVAIVTGAASGIGREMAIRLSGLGYRLVLLDLDHEGLQRLDTKLSTTADAENELVAADVSDAEAWRGLADTLSHDGADVSLLVQSAGVLLAGHLVDSEPASLLRVVSTNLCGTLLGANAIGPLLALSAADGAATPLPRGLLNIASIFATVSPPGFAAYNASKAGVVSLTETLRGEWAPLGLTATAVLPGVTPTGLFDRAEYADPGLQPIVSRRVGTSELTAEGVADAALRAYGRRQTVASIGKRAGRLHWLKRWVPDRVLRGVAAEANRELDAGG